VSTPDRPTPASVESIAFIGGGNMARSLIAGLRADGVPAASIRVAEPVGALRDALQNDFGVDVMADNAAAATGAATWVLAAKPQVLRGVCESLAAQVQRQQPLLVSIAAGITTAQLDRWLGGGTAIVRAMPNMPALLGAGVSGLYGNARVDDAGRRRAERLLAAAGETVWLADESWMDAVTAVSGSGPAYLFLLAESMLDAARSQGLPADAARTLVLQTLLGAARMLTEEDATPAELRRRVTSPGGTTQAAIDAFQAGGLDHLVAAAIEAATQRSRQLSRAND
jgi:pyrroline-5-carboxylate reductase